MTKNKLAHSLKVVIPSAAFTAKIDTRLSEIQKEAKFPGFRPGQAPMNLIKSKYEAAVKGEALDALVQEEVQKAFEKEKIKPALRPKVELEKFEDGKDITVKIEVEALPEIKVKELADLTVDTMKAEAGAEEIETSLKKMALNVMMQPKKDGFEATEKVEESRKTKKDDVLVIDFVGSIDGKEFQGGTGKDYYLQLGSNTFIPGFEDQLTGHKVGDKVDVEVTFPADYHAKDLAGKKAVFKTDIKELRRFNFDALAKFFKMENLDKLKEMIKAELEKEYAHVARMHAKRALLDVLAKEYDFDIPQGMLDMEYNSIMAQYEQAKKTNKLSDDEKNKPEDDLKKEYRDIADRRVRLGLLLAEIANLNKVVLTQEDLTNAVLAEARRYPGQEKMVFEFYQKNPKALDSLRAPLFEEKVVDFILGKVKRNEKAVSVKDLYAYDPDAPEAAPKKAKNKKKGK